MRTIMLAAIFMVAVALSLLSQQTESEPSLDDTLSFMNRALEQDTTGSIENLKHLGYVPKEGDDGSCQVELRLDRMENFLIPDGQRKIPGNYRAGIPDHYEITYGVMHQEFHTDLFNLKDIDPESIKVDHVFSQKAVGDHKDEPGLPPADLPIVVFKTANLIKAVHLTDFVDESKVKPGLDQEMTYRLEPGAKNGQRLVRDQTTDVFVMKSADRADRLVKAFKHAVTLCGGKPSAF